jgi:hypothetical protein
VPGCRDDHADRRKRERGAARRQGRDTPASIRNAPLSHVMQAKARYLTAYVTQVKTQDSRVKQSACAARLATARVPRGAQGAQGAGMRAREHVRAQWLTIGSSGWMSMADTHRVPSKRS